MNGPLPLLRFYNPIKTYIFDTYFPDHLKLDPNNRDDWKIYADKVRIIMAKVLK
jgi:hypothetical protein